MPNYEKAIALNSNEAGLWKNISTCYHHIGDYNKEITCLDRALSINKDMPEALISKAISIGEQLKDYDHALLLLEQANANCKEIHNLKYIYYWKSMFYLITHKYEDALIQINIGLGQFPGDYYLKSLEFQIYKSSWQINDIFKKNAELFLIKEIENYPNAIPLRIEYLKIINSKMETEKYVSFLLDTLKLYGFSFSKTIIINLAIADIIRFLFVIEDYRKYKGKLDTSNLFSNNFNITLTEYQRIELFIGTFYAKNYNSIRSINILEFPSAINELAKNFLELNVCISEIILIKYNGCSIDEKSARITEVITSLPEILLREFSRQIAWIASKCKIELTLLDEAINSSQTLIDWFSLCIEPILKGAYNIFQWDKKE